MRHLQTWGLVMGMGLSGLAGCQGRTESPSTADMGVQVISRDSEPAEPSSDERLTFADQVVLRNDQVQVAVSPQAGRIVWFGPAEGRNLLWINTQAGNTPYIGGGRTYYNLGGDKIWPLVQSLWARAFGEGNWPPDGVLDGQPWELIDQGDHHVTMQSPLSPHLGVQIRRVIRLSPTRGQVTIQNRITQVQPTIYPVMIWSITQVHPPQYSLLGISPDQPLDTPWTPLSRGVETSRITLSDDGHWARFDYGAGGGQKIGTLGTWVAGVWDDYAFVQATQYHPGGSYPDASSAQVYYDENVLELEMLSPAEHLQPGKTLTNTVHWWLIPRGDMDAAALAAQAQSLIRGADGG